MITRGTGCLRDVLSVGFLAPHSDLDMIRGQLVLPPPLPGLLVLAMVPPPPRPEMHGDHCDLYITVKSKRKNNSIITHFS